MFAIGVYIKKNAGLSGIWRNHEQLRFHVRQNVECAAHVLIFPPANVTFSLTALADSNRWGICIHKLRGPELSAYLAVAPFSVTRTFEAG